MVIMLPVRRELEVFFNGDLKEISEKIDPEIVREEKEKRGGRGIEPLTCCITTKLKLRI